MSTHRVSKSFGHVEVLTHIDLEIHTGEVLAILGENGAGKSTLVKLLAGYEEVSAGELRLATADGSTVPVASWNIEVAEQHGIVLIHQELNLAEQLSAAENIFLGNELKRGLFLDQKRMLRLARKYLLALNCQVDPATPVSELAVADKQMVEIAKAYARNSKLLILDEPTAVLTSKESEVLFRLIERLKQQAVAIIYISHKLEEIERIADRITILRDGEMVGCYPASSLSTDDMARLMVGRELSNLFPNIPAPLDEIALRVVNASVPGLVQAASFELRRGEVLGFAGLVGSGRTALMEAIVGLRKLTASAQIEVAGKAVSYPNLAAARDDGVAYLTKDRKASGLLLNLNLVFNFSLLSLSALFLQRKYAGLLIDQKKEQRAFEQAIKTFDIRLKDSAITAGDLSGGNQQKLLLAKIMAAVPRIIIIDEPTRGIDIGTKSQIYHFIAELAANGHSIILISSDMMEIIGLSHRVAVMCRGELTGILVDDEIEEHEIMRYATGLKRQPGKNNSEDQLCA